MVIDWKDPQVMVSKHWNVKDCLLLPQWNRMADDRDGLNNTVKTNLAVLCAAMDIVFDHVLQISGQKLYTSVTFRPPEYNKLVKGAPASKHLEGLAMDSCIEGISCDSIRYMIEPKLPLWRMRCEDRPGSKWIHLDLGTPIIPGHWFFKP